MMPRKSFIYGDDRIEYEILFSSSKRNRVAIHVHPDATVQVDAPPDQDLAVIHRAVLKRARWIKAHVDEARHQRGLALPRSYRSGECLYYLGRRYQLKVRSRAGAVPTVKLTCGQIRVETSSREPSIIKDRLSAWYRARASEVFDRRLREIADRVVWLKALPDSRSGIG